MRARAAAFFSALLLALSANAADKTQLNTGYEHYSDIVFALGFVESSGNFVDLVSGTTACTVSGTTTSRGVDGTYGSYISLESADAIVDCGDVAVADGHAAMTVLMLALNDNTVPPSIQRAYAKEGSGADSMLFTWSTSQNTDALVGLSAANSISTVTDGLDEGDVGVLATNVNWIGITYDGSNVNQVRNNNIGPAAAGTGSVNATSHVLAIGNRAAADQAWTGDIFAFVILDIALDSGDIAALVSDWSQIFESDAAAPVISSPTPSGTLATETTATLGATSDDSTGTFYGVVDDAAGVMSITASQIKLGNDSGDATAIASCNAAVSTTSPSCGVTGLTANTAYSYAVVHTNATGDSNVETGTFTTAAAAGSVVPIIMQQIAANDDEYEPRRIAANAR